MKRARTTRHFGPFCAYIVEWVDDWRNRIPDTIYVLPYRTSWSRVRDFMKHIYMNADFLSFADNRKFLRGGHAWDNMVCPGSGVLHVGEFPRCLVAYYVRDLEVEMDEEGAETFTWTYRHRKHTERRSRTRRHRTVG